MGAKDIEQKEEAVRQQLAKLSGELEKVRRAMLLGYTDSGESTEQLFKRRDDRRRAEAVAAALKKGNDQLVEARRSAAQAEKHAEAMATELDRQRGVLESARKKVHVMGEQVNEGAQIVGRMEKKGWWPF